MSLKCKKIREKHNMSQEELAEKMLISESWVIVYEKPGIMPSLHFTENFKRIFNVTEEEIRD